MRESAQGSISELSQFIETGEFRYAAQRIKQVDDTGCGTRWFQWLVRPTLDDPTVTTEDFIRAVESTDLALDLDMRVIEDALTWLDLQPSNTRLMVDVSSGSFSNNLFPSHVSLLLNDSNLIPGQLCFDIRMNSAIGNLSGVTRFVRIVRHLGCQIALEAGESRNPALGLFAPMGLIEYLKIDCKWVSNAADSDLYRQSLESILGFGQRMNLKVIADGVDNHTQLEIVRELGVDYYQGCIDGEPQIIVGGEEEEAEEEEFLADLDRSA